MTPDGGNIKKLDVQAMIQDVIKWAVVAMPVPNMDENDPIEPFESKNTNSTLAKLKASFKVPMRDSEGKLREKPETINIKTLTDFEDESLLAQVGHLVELQDDIDFLEAFQKELESNTALRGEVNELIMGDEGKNLQRFLNFLENWIQDLSTPKSQFVNLITH